jgi:hypothetical protein
MSFRLRALLLFGMTLRAEIFNRNHVREQRECARLLGEYLTYDLTVEEKMEGFCCQAPSGPRPRPAPWDLVGN